MARLVASATVLLGVQQVLSGAAPGAFPHGCTVNDYDYGSATILQDEHGDKILGQKVADSAACQKLCADTSGCETFSFFFISTECWLGSNATSDLKVASDVVTGPVTCSETPPACTATFTGDLDTFPTADASTNMKDWSTGYQPQRLQCYPTGADKACQDHLSVVDKTTKSFIGDCTGLTEQAALETYAECRTKCIENADCTGYQFKDKKCYHGVGTACGKKSLEKPEASDRFQRGKVRALLDLKGRKVAGLKNVFTREEMNAIEVGDQGTGFANSRAACSEICYSNLECSFWQLSTAKGCFVETREDRVTYPLSSANLLTKAADADAEHMIAGELIQRTCAKQEAPEDDIPINGKDNKKKDDQKEGRPWIQYLLIGLVACCILALIAGAIMKCCKKDKKRVPRSRGIKKPAKAPEATPLMVTQATSAVQMTPVVYQQPQQVVYQQVQQPQVVYQQAPQVIYEAQPQMVIQGGSHQFPVGAVPISAAPSYSGQYINPV